MSSESEWAIFHFHLDQNEKWVRENYPNDQWERKKPVLGVFIAIVFVFIVTQIIWRQLRKRVLRLWSMVYGCFFFIWINSPFYNNNKKKISFQINGVCCVFTHVVFYFISTIVVAVVVAIYSLYVCMFGWYLEHTGISIFFITIKNRYNGCVCMALKIQSNVYR